MLTYCDFGPGNPRAILLQSDKSGDFVWDDNWEVGFGAVDRSSGGGTIPVSALAAIAVGVGGFLCARKCKQGKEQTPRLKAK